MKPSTKYRVKQGGRFSVFILNGRNEVVELVSFSPGDIFVNVTRMADSDVASIFKKTENVWWNGLILSGSYLILDCYGKLGILGQAVGYPLQDYIEEQ